MNLTPTREEIDATVKALLERDDPDPEEEAMDEFAVKFRAWFYRAVLALGAGVLMGLVVGCWHWFIH